MHHLTVRMLTTALLAAGCAPAPETTTAEPPLVVIAPAAERPFAWAVTVEGTVVPRRRADVAAQLTGRLSSVAVRDGDPVTAGETVLFTTDAAELERARDLAAEAVRVAELSIAERTANLARVSAEHLQAERDFERYERLYTRDQAVSKAVYEEVQARLAQIAAAQTHAEALLELEKGRQGQARLELAVAERRLGDAAVRAPLTGTVSRRDREPGEWAEAGETVLAITDAEQVEIRVPLATRYWTAVVPGTTEAEGATDGTTKRLMVAAKGPTADPESRTFTVTLHTVSDGPALLPGALAVVRIILGQRTALAVPEAAVLRQAGEAIVFVAREGRAVRVAVEAGTCEDRFVEITAGALTPGETVIVRGHTLLTDGDHVRFAEDKPPPDAPQ